jgi:Flp pilus assembly protein TadG
MVEGMLMMLPFLALVFLIVDTSYAIFVKATLQYAVQAGATYAATDTTNGLTSAVQSYVSAQSLSLVSASSVNVNFYTPAMATPGAGTTANASGNIVQISVTYAFSPLAPLFRSGASINLTASAASVLTANPPPSL